MLTIAQMLAIGMITTVASAQDVIATCAAAKAQPEPHTADDYVRNVNLCVAEADYASALNFALQNREQTKHGGDKDQQLRAMLVEAAVYRYLDLLPQSLELLRQSIDDPQATHYPLRLLRANNNAADLLLRLNRLEEAEAAGRKAAIFADEQGDDSDRATVAGTLAEIAIRQKRYPEARQAIGKCLALGASLQSRQHLVLCNQLEAELWLQQQRWPQALRKAEDTIAEANRLGFVPDLPRLYLTKATAEAALGRQNEAIASANNGLILARSRGELQSSLALQRFLRDQWLQLKRVDLAQHASDQIQMLSEKLFDQRLANTLAVERVRWELGKKEQEIAALRQQNALQQAVAETAIAQRTAAIGFSLLAVALFAMGYGYWMHRRNLQRAEAANRELQRLNELKDQVLANTSHELRTPLNGIIGLSDILLSETNSTMSAESTDIVRMIHECGGQLSALVDDILDYSQMRADKLMLQRRAMPLAPLVDDVLRLLRPLANSKGLKLDSGVAADLPPVNVDGGRIKQVLHNLIGNAIKFTEQGSVTISAEANRSGIVVSVQDTGIGIAADRIERIFEPFEQADGASSRRYGGVGLGLPIARQLLRAHGGELTVVSAPGHGSVFRFSLPLA